MKENDIYKQLVVDLHALTIKYSIVRLKINTLNFDREFKLGQDGNLQLVSTKAVIRALGKVTKVPIGDDQEHKTFEEAEVAVKKYWSEYYKKIRANRSPAQLKAEARRQKRYRERRKQDAVTLKRQQ